MRGEIPVGCGSWGLATLEQRLGRRVLGYTPKVPYSSRSPLFPKKPQPPLGGTETLLCLPPPDTTSVHGLFCSEASALISVSLAEGAYAEGRSISHFSVLQSPTGGSRPCTISLSDLLGLSSCISRSLPQASISLDSLSVVSGIPQSSCQRPV